MSTERISQESLLGDKKKKAAEALLANAAGIVVRGADGIAAVLKGENIFEVVREPNAGTGVTVWAICGSAAEQRKFEAVYHRAESELRNTFSERDLNVRMIHDLAAAYLSSRFDNRKVERAASMEFIMAQVHNGEMVFYSINCDGASRSLDNADGFAVIGCGSDQKRNALRAKLAEYDFANMKVQKIIKTLESVLEGEYSGRFLGTGFSFAEKEPKAKVKTRPRSKRVKKGPKKR